MRTFHDAVVTDVDVNLDCLVFHLEQVTTFDKQHPSLETGRLIIKGVVSFREDDVPKEYVGIMDGFDDGQILRLVMDQSSVQMLIEWENYVQRHTKTNVYEITGALVVWEPESISNRAS